METNISDVRADKPSEDLLKTLSAESPQGSDDLASQLSGLVDQFVPLPRGSSFFVARKLGETATSFALDTIIERRKKRKPIRRTEPRFGPRISLVASKLKTARSPSAGREVRRRCSIRSPTSLRSSTIGP